MKVLRWIWQFPQNIVGWIYLKTRKLAYHQTYDNKVEYYDVFSGGSVSLGDYIFIAYPTSETIHHEYGHHRQSLMLGPLYLLLIGLPSLCGYWWDVWFHDKWSYNDRDKWYYGLPWEKWADRLGGVKRYYPNK